MNFRRMRQIVAMLAIGALAALPLPADDKKKDPDEIGNRKVDGRVNWYSMEKEIAMGKQYAMEIERQAKIVDDPIIAEYVNRVGQNLVRNSDVKVPVSIKVLETDEPNAMALPGGFFFVNTGLLKLAQNESEVAGVMGHELAHIAARHATRQMTRAGIVNLATIPMMILGGGWAMYGIYQASNLLIPMTFLRFSREFESEADLLGLQYMYKAGYDPNGFVDMFERLESMEKRKPGTISKMFTSHPPTGDRIVKVQEITAKYLKEKPEYVVTTSEFDDVRDRLMMLENRRKSTASDDPNRPRLRKAPGASTTSTIDGDDTSNQQTKEGDDERPTLKRRDQPQN
ncbi:MAG: M48 family metallopeptidase [Bryobacteraceae bacterium]